MKNKANPWQNGLLATSALAAVFFSSTLLWQQGYPQWAFLLVFSATWALISISWSNVEYTEESGSILARIVDQNFNQVHERLEQLEAELEVLQEKTPGGDRQSN